MKTFLSILIFTLLVLLQKSAHGQVMKYGDKYVFGCPADSIAFLNIEKLKNKGIDNIFRFYYDYDNGRIENATYYILWQEKGFENIRIITGCEQAIIKDSLLNGELMQLFKLYSDLKVDNTKGFLPVRGSHSMGFYVKNYISSKNKAFHVREDSRDVKDPRVYFINQFYKLIIARFPLDSD